MRARREWEGVAKGGKGVRTEQVGVAKGDRHEKGGKLWQGMCGAGGLQRAGVSSLCLVMRGDTGTGPCKPGGSSLAVAGGPQMHGGLQQVLAAVGACRRQR